MVSVYVFPFKIGVLFLRKLFKGNLKENPLHGSSVLNSIKCGLPFQVPVYRTAGLICWYKFLNMLSQLTPIVTVYYLQSIAPCSENKYRSFFSNCSSNYFKEISNYSTMNHSIMIQLHISHCYLPSRYPVRSATANTTCSVTCAVPTNSAHHTLF